MLPLRRLLGKKTALATKRKRYYSHEDKIKRKIEEFKNLKTRDKQFAKSVQEPPLKTKQHQRMKMPKIQHVITVGSGKV